MPLINQPQLNIGDINIAANPYIDPETVASCFLTFTLMEGGEVTFYQSDCDLRNTVIVTNEYSDPTATPSAASVSDLDFFPILHESGYSSMYESGDGVDLVDPGSQVSLLFPSNTLGSQNFQALHIMNRDYVILKQGLQVSSGSKYGVHVATVHRALPSLPDSPKQGMVVTPGGYWEDTTARKPFTDEWEFSHQGSYARERHMAGMYFHLINASTLANDEYVKVSLSYTLGKYATN